MDTYVALIRKASDSDYSVDFPDVPGCVTAGKDLDEALAFAREALAGHLRLLAEKGEPLPQASRLEAVMAESENRDAVAALVPAPMIRGKSVRVNVMLDEYLLRAIDKLAGDRGRSEFLAEAARARIAGTKGEMPVALLAAAKTQQAQRAKRASASRKAQTAKVIAERNKARQAQKTQWAGRNRPAK